MGGCWSSFLSSKSNYITQNDGNEEDFYNLYLEDKLLGEGEFGQVKLVHNMKTHNVYAVKILRKGIVFKDNVVYAPLKCDVLQNEVTMLRTLGGKQYCLTLQGVYETPRFIYLVTELCNGGSMMEFVSRLGNIDGNDHDDNDELLVSDVSRIIYQTLSAIHHCASHYIIHRDVKPDNVLFLDNTHLSDLRLVDFGSGCIDDGPSPPIVHTTFAGSAFYISPELFQRTYTSKTDVWSCGALLYVLVAGYPADELQKAFNVMHKSSSSATKKKNRNLRAHLPNLPQDLPSSFYDLLEELLTYRHKSRKSAGELLQHDFCQLHKQNQQQQQQSSVENANGTAAVETLESATTLSQQQQQLSIQQVVADSLSPLATTDSTTSTTASGRTTTTHSTMRLTSSVKRHSLFMDFKRFERSVTTLMATLLSKQDFQTLMEQLSKRNNAATTAVKSDRQVLLSTTASNDNDNENNRMIQQAGVTKNLNIIPIRDLKVMLKELGAQKCLDNINQLPNTANYESFAYHVDLLAQFQRETVILSASSSGGLERRHSFSGDNDHQQQQTNSSVHGSDVYKTMQKNRGATAVVTSSSRNDGGMLSLSSSLNRRKKGDNLSNSWHLGQSSAR